MPPHLPTTEGFRTRSTPIADQGYVRDINAFYLPHVCTRTNALHMQCPAHERVFVENQYKLLRQGWYYDSTEQPRLHGRIPPLYANCLPLTCNSTTSVPFQTSQTHGRSFLLFFLKKFPLPCGVTHRISGRQLLSTCDNNAASKAQDVLYVLFLAEFDDIPGLTPPVLRGACEVEKALVTFPGYKDACRQTESCECVHPLSPLLLLPGYSSAPLGTFDCSSIG